MSFNKIHKIVIPCVIAGSLLLGSINAAASSKYIKVGTQGEEVKQIQTELKKLGFFDEKITGYFGEVTKNAVEKYQKSNGFSVDGVVGPATWKVLVGANDSNTVVNFSRILKLGIQGEDVKKAQTKLKELGYFNQELTGYYGQLTKNSVIAFQKAKGFTADGMIGSETWEALINGQVSVTTSVQQAATSYSRVLKEGLKGEDVKQLQAKLKEIGYFNGEATGFYGQVTKESVMAYQKADGITPDGMVGPSTWKSLFGEGVATQLSNKPEFERILKDGLRGEDVKKVQTKLKELGYFTANSTGVYGNITKTAVKNYQYANGLKADGVIGKTTWDKLFSGNSVSANSREATSRGTTPRESGLVSWSKAKNIFEIGSVATVIDINSGIQFKVKRTYGTNHADVEPLTADDTYKLKQAYSGTWSWSRRPIVVIVNGQKIAASMNGMPHAGLEWAAANKYVSGRSGGYGSGLNLDAVKGNNMNGHICFHFYQSRTHGTNRVDSKHQSQVKKAANYIDNN